MCIVYTKSVDRRVGWWRDACVYIDDNSTCNFLFLVTEQQGQQHLTLCFSLPTDMYIHTHFWTLCTHIYILKHIVLRATNLDMFAYPVLWTADVFNVWPKPNLVSPTLYLLAGNWSLWGDQQSKFLSCASANGVILYLLSMSHLM